MSKIVVNMEAALSTAAAQAGLDRFRSDAERNPVNERVRLDTADTKAQLAGLRAQLDKTIGSYTGKIDLNTKQALASLLKLRTQLDREAGKVGIEVDLKQDRLDAQLADMEAKVAAAGALAGAEGGEASASSFGDAFKGGLTSPAVIGGAIVAGLAVAPGLFAIAGAAGAVALGAAFAIKGSPALQSAAKGLLGDLETTMEGAASVLDKPIAGAIGDIESQLPAIGSLFATTFKDVGPDIQPMVQMLGDLVKDTLPGFNTLMADAQGPLKSFFDTAGQIVGTGLGNFFKSLVPGVAPSLSILTSLFQIMGNLLPVIGHLADAVATELAPALEQTARASGALKDALSGNLPGALDQLSGKQDKTSSSAGLLAGAWHAAGKAAGFVGSVMNTPISSFDAMFNSSSKATGAINANTDASGKLTVKEAALALAVQAHAVAANNAWLKQANLNSVTGNAVGISGTLAGNTTNLASKLNAEQSAVANLTGAWDILNGVTGNAQQAAQSYASAFNTLVSDQRSGTATSTQLWGDWNNLSQAAETNIDKMTTLGSATDATTTTQKFAHKAVLDSIAGLITAAGSNAAYQQSAIQVAAQNGFTGTTFSQLKAWVDKNGGSMNNLQSDTDKASGSLSNAQTKALDAGSGISTLTQAVQKAGVNVGITQGQTDLLTAAMITNKGHVDNSNTSFDTFAGKLGISKDKANDLWGKLKNVAGNYAANVSVKVSGGGSVAIKGTVQVDALTDAIAGSSGASTGSSQGVSSGSSQTLHSLGADGSGKLAAGGVVPPGSGPAGRDSFHAMLAPGELVIPSTHAPKFGDMARRAGIPGFAAGGITWPLTPSSGFAQAGSVDTSLGAVAEPGFAKATATALSNQTVTALAAALKSGISSAVAAAKAAMAAAAGTDFNGSVPGGFGNLLTIAKYLMANGLNRGAAAGIAATIDGESRGDPESVNCVPLTYKVVTERGILAHDEVRVGDRVPAYNLETQRFETGVVLDVPYHDDAKVCRIGNSSWSVTCTHDHMWITDTGLVRADQFPPGAKVLLGDGWYEEIEYFLDLGRDDTFCLTTTAHTWTTIADDDPRPILTGNSSGFGLIGWTGNTVGLPPGYTHATGNVQYDMAQQLKGIIGYMNARGGRGPLNAAGNISPVDAGDVWSRYEAPHVPLSDTRPAVANELYAMLGGSSTPSKAIQAQKQVQAKVNQVKPHSAGGVLSEPIVGWGVNSGIKYSMAENGPEYISPSMDTGTSGMPPMTQTQGQALIQLLQQQNQLLQQLPHGFARAQQNGLGAGMRRGMNAVGG